MRERIKTLNVWFQKHILKKLPELTIFETIILVFALGLYLFWASRITLETGLSTSAPDEGLRYMLPDFIFRYNRLPTGYDPEVIHAVGNHSYAFYPQWIGPILSAFFMNLANLIRPGPFVFFFAARMTSVLAGVTTVFFVNRTLRILTKNKRISLLGMTLIAFWPQFAFLSSYVNNDIIALAGVSIMCYAVASSLKDKWTIKNSITLALGKAICLLSYLNSAGFVLAFGLYFLVSNAIDIRKKQIDMKAFRRNFLIIFLIVALLWFPFLIRNAALYEGDFLGMNAFNRAKVEWEQNESMIWAEANARVWSEFHGIPWTENTVYAFLEFITAMSPLEYRGGYVAAGHPFEGTLVELFQHDFWLRATVQSFIVTIYFAVINHFPRYFYIPYLLVILSPLLGLLGIKKVKVKEMSFLVACMLGIAITIGLFLYYNLSRDMQSQGRYIITVLVPLIIGASLGVHTLLEKFPENLKRIVVYSGVIGCTGMMLIVLRDFMRL